VNADSYTHDVVSVISFRTTVVEFIIHATHYVLWLPWRHHSLIYVILHLGMLLKSY